MRALSNFLRKGDGPDPGPAEYRLAQPPELHPALSLLLGSGGAGAGEEQVLDFLQFAAHRGIDLARMWVIASGGRVWWAMLPITSPGRTALLFTPSRRPEGLDAGPLIDAVCDDLAARGTHLAQVLLDPGDDPGRRLYAAHDFREMAELLYLQAPAPRSIAAVEPPPSLWWQNYSAQTHAAFAKAILESYQQSLDCPGLNGLRHVDDVIAGHKASGEFDPRFWFLLSERDLPLGVLLLGRVPRTDAAELVYLGLAPAARHRGLGDLMMRHALWAVREMGLSRLTLAVDSQNAPALRLYYRHGLQRIGSKFALMRDLRTPAPHPPPA